MYWVSPSRKVYKVTFWLSEPWGSESVAPLEWLVVLERWAKVVTVHFPWGEWDRVPTLTWLKSERLTYSSAPPPQSGRWPGPRRLQESPLRPSSLRGVSLDGLDAALELLGKQVTGSPTVGAGGALQPRAQRPQQRRLHVLAELELERTLWRVSLDHVGSFIPWD